MITVNDRLTEFVELLFSSDYEASKALDMSRGSLYNITKGKRNPRAATLLKFAEIGCNLHWLLTGDGEMYANSEAGKALRKRIDAIGHNRSILVQKKEIAGSLAKEGGRSRDTGKTQITKVSLPLVSVSPDVAAVPEHSRRVEVVSERKQKAYELLDIEELTIPNPEQSVIMRYKGEPLPAFGIQPDDWLVIDRKQEPAPGSFVIARIRRKPATVYRMEQRNNRMIFVDGMKEEVSDVSGKEHRIEGVVITVFRRFHHPPENRHDRTGNEQAGKQPHHQ